MTPSNGVDEMLALVKRADKIGSQCDPECEGRCRECPDEILRDMRNFIAARASARPAVEGGEVTPEKIDAALRAWFASPPSERRSMKAALIAARLAAKPVDEGVREALKPFADAASYYDDANLSPGEYPWKSDDAVNPIFTVGQLRTARSALSSTGERKP